SLSSAGRLRLHAAACIIIKTAETAAGVAASIHWGRFFAPACHHRRETMHAANSLTRYLAGSAAQDPPDEPYLRHGHRDRCRRWTASGADAAGLHPEPAQRAARGSAAGGGGGAGVGGGAF